MAPTHSASIEARCNMQATCKKHSSLPFLPFVAPYFEDGASKLPLVDLREVLNLPGELAIQF